MRDCAQPLLQQARTWTCPRGHSFDIARSGYVNLLQPQDRKSANAGDSPASIDARARLLAAGIGAAIVDAFATHAHGALTGDDRVADLGCGSGDLIGALVGRQAVAAVGLDLSAYAVDRAARRVPTSTWVVANADRRLPLLDGSVTLVTSLHARRNPAECARVLATSGHLLIGVPAADDVIELRDAVQGAGIERDRVEGVLAEHAPHFDLVDRATARERHRLDASQLRDLLQGTYRGTRTSAAARIEALDTLDVTFATDLLLLKRRQSHATPRHDIATVTPRRQAAKQGLIERAPRGGVNRGSARRTRRRASGRTCGRPGESGRPS